MVSTATRLFWCSHARAIEADIGSWLCWSFAKADYEPDGGDLDAVKDSAPPYTMFEKKGGESGNAMHALLKK